jgi:hypothetical protein
MSATYFVLSYVALTLVILVGSFPLLASVCLLQPLLVANFSLILLHLAIAEGVQATGP